MFSEISKDVVMEKATAGFQPKYFSQSTPIAQSTLSAAQLFNMGGRPVRLDIDTRERQQMAVVKEFDLDDRTARKLGRKSNLMEATASPIRGRSSHGEIDRYLARVRVPRNMRENAKFFFVSAARRNGSNSEQPTRVSGKHDIAAEDSFILGLMQEKETLLLMMILPEGRGVSVFDFSTLVDVLDEASEDSTDSSAGAIDAVTYTDDSTADFAVCYNDCLLNVPPWAIVIVGGICTGCVTAVGIAVAGEPISNSVMAGVCTGCVAAVGVVLANCVLMCHEKFGV